MLFYFFLSEEGKWFLRGLNFITTPPQTAHKPATHKKSVYATLYGQFAARTSDTEDNVSRQLTRPKKAFFLKFYFFLYCLFILYFFRFFIFRVQRSERVPPIYFVPFIRTKLATRPFSDRFASPCVVLSHNVRRPVCGRCTRGRTEFQSREMEKFRQIC